MDLPEITPENKYDPAHHGPLPWWNYRPAAPLPGQPAPAAHPPLGDRTSAPTPVGSCRQNGLDRPDKVDKVYRPAHYSRFEIEPVNFIGTNRLDFLVGNVVKYVLRFDAKNGIEDLEKAKRYLEMLIKREQGDKGWSF